MEPINQIVSQIHAMPSGDYIFSGLLFILSVVGAFIVYNVVKRYGLAMADKSKTILDEELIFAINKPLAYGIVAAGGYFALLSLDVASSSVQILADVFYVVGLLIALMGILRVVNALIKWYGLEVSKKTKSNLDDRFLPIVNKIFKILAYVFVLMMLLSHFGIEITPLIAGLGVSGLVIALALQEPVSHFFAGTFVSTEGSVHIGDYIELEGGVAGYVEDVSWRATRIRTWTNNLIIVPNSKLANTIFTNYEVPKREMGFVVSCGVSYNDDLEKVEKVAIEVGKQVLKKEEGAIKDYQPIVRFKNFGDSNIDFIVILRSKTRVDSFKIKHEFIKALKARFDKEGIEISFPARTVYFHDELNVKKK